ncbi:hypothetical protein SAMN02745146_2010 [Hymenobacter daecheongensis DSM 21074]|uniref:Uncharacterized protein n=1 Tax=Hymenobacter daecheongensis DSM 21074 TaxID=1121955 RepID=A0A1M6FBX8_9BACT|nr:hypothetical protein [Hymenobacter daecheongensis]SHI95146.1 hypothetical protein SAMN02745146_2010 [Hymenobacter daecheongensis DSM 21074]
MENPEERRARLLVEQWLAAHPERIRNRRTRPDTFLNWKLAAIRYVKNGNPHDTSNILEWFATQAEGAAMED